MTDPYPTRADHRRNHAPLSGSYAAAVGIALLGLCPFIVLTTAFALTSRQIVTDLHTSMFGAQLSNALANAAYAFGAVTAADLVLRVSRRWLYVACEAVFVIGSVLGAVAPGIALFTTGRVLQGLTTGILLVVALPPLVTGHGVRRLPLSALYINLGLFGMVTLGPVVGGFAGTYGGWRLLFVAVAALGLAGLVLGLVAFPVNDPPSPRVGFDASAVPLAFGATFLPFLAVSWLTRGGFGAPVFLSALVIGVALLVALVVAQFRKPSGLVPVRPISNTLPVVGIGVAMVGGAAFTALLELVITYLTEVLGRSPVVVGGLLAPMLIGLAVGAVLFERLLPSRWLALLAFSGLAAIAISAAALLTLSAGDATALVPTVSVLLGFGAGAAVSPGLFMAGLSVPSSRIGPTFALVELLRSEAAFILAPVLGYLATVTGAGLAGGVHRGVGIALGLLVVVAALLGGLLALGGVGPSAPDLRGWLEDGGTGFHSPRLAAAVRGR